MKRVKEATKTAILCSLIGAILLSPAQIYFSSDIVNAFSDNGLVISKGITAMFFGSIFFWTYGFQTIGIILLLSVGRKSSDFIFSIAKRGLANLARTFLLIAFFIFFF